MFESTQEAQALDHGERKLGTLSAAVLAHLGVGVTILLATALVVPPVHPPDAPAPVFVFTPNIRLDDVSPRPAAPPPKKGADVTEPRTALAPPPVAPVAPPSATPDALPSITPDPAPPGQDGSGDGTAGVSDGSSSGVTGGVGDVGGGGGEGLEGGPAELTADMVRPVLLQKVSPDYPQVARRAGLGGRVTVRAVIAPDGSVETVEVYASSNPLFNDAAVDAVRQWRYRPASMNGKPVRVYLTVVVDFLVR
jgi:protein TonB